MLNMVLPVLIILCGFFVFSQAVDPILGHASHHVPFPKAPTACGHNNLSKLFKTSFPAAAGKNLWKGPVSCGQKYIVRCISDGAPLVCKAGAQIEVFIRDCEDTMRGNVSAYGVDLVVQGSGFSKIASPSARTIPIEFQKV